MSYDEYHDDYTTRCPHCGLTDLIEAEDIEGEGLNDMNCGHCGQDYTIQVHVSWSYTSPPLTEAAKESDGE